MVSLNHTFAREETMQEVKWQLFLFCINFGYVGLCSGVALLLIKGHLFPKAKYQVKIQLKKMYQPIECNGCQSDFEYFYCKYWLCVLYLRANT